MRLILLGFLLHWKKTVACRWHASIFSNGQEASLDQQFSQLSIMLGLQKNGELLQEVETTMVSSS